MLWLYGKDHQKITLLRNEEQLKVKSSLPSGDKELSFKYKKDNRNRKDIQCEGYLRTETDEYVIKDIEQSGKKDTITAKLNLEELEGKTFEDGFKTTFATFEQCMEEALAGTGWSVAFCDVQKRRTIKKDAGCSALEIINQCVSTYKIELRYDTLAKKIYAYEHIGSDRGRYFMETLNLRQLAIGKNTYDFFTVLIPIGKDGLTIESVNGGKKYIENFTYCNKRKATTWIDRRYTNPDALLEDATLRLEDMAKPYTTYEVDVADLAKQSRIYKTTLDYSLGDTMTLISKTESIMEKQRIVSMTEYPQQPELNFCELSSARKTFADLQQEETEELYDAIGDTAEVAGEQGNDYADNLFETLSDDVEGVRKAVQALDTKISGMNTDAQIEEINGNIQQLTASVQALVTICEGHEERMKTVEKVIGEVQEQAAGVQEMKDAVTAMQQSVAQIRQTVIETSQSVSDLKETARDQGEKIIAISEKINALHPVEEPEEPEDQEEEQPEGSEDLEDQPGNSDPEETE